MESVREWVELEIFLLNKTIPINKYSVFFQILKCVCVCERDDSKRGLFEVNKAVMGGGGRQWQEKKRQALVVFSCRIYI